MFYLLQNDQPTGPYSGEQVTGMLKSGTITSATLAAAAGGTEWAPVSSFPAFADSPPPQAAMPTLPPVPLPTNHMGPADGSSFPRWARIAIGCVFIVPALLSLAAELNGIFEYLNYKPDKFGIPRGTINDIVISIPVFAVSAGVIYWAFRRRKAR